jgi:hypothetical protein
MGPWRDWSSRFGDILLWKDQDVVTHDMEPDEGRAGLFDGEAGTSQLHALHIVFSIDLNI